MNLSFAHSLSTPSTKWLFLPLFCRSPSHSFIRKKKSRWALNEITDFSAMKQNENLAPGSHLLREAK
ncbi:hypothetical protein XELAEV_18007881mg [Xenopus laevis]|uniref:Uncharacterized protein n=1 Tax=Xenopus laevis TaxID=8355 RepID=A0A974E1N2_XENLA|nr:hypothetical protein XELAEV_18007881mg [Xenopus laevis]